MSAIDICNAALAKNHSMEPIPETADLENPVGKVQTIAARFYPAARRAALRMGMWTCILNRVRLTKDEWAAETEWAAGDRIVAAGAVFECTVAGTSDQTEPAWPGIGTVTDGTVTWEFRYDVIANLPTENNTGLSYAYGIPADYILKKDTQDLVGQPVHSEIERGVLYADSPEVALLYIPDEEDDTLYDPLLREVVIAQVASAFSYPITGSHENEVAFAQAAAYLADQAAGRARQEQRQGPPPSEEWAPGLFDTRYRP